MGRVFSFDEISGGRVPHVQDFPIVVEKIRETFGRSPGVVGAALCGSVLQKSYNERSDIDCVVLYDWQRRYSVGEAIEDIYRFSNKLNVPVEIHPIDMETAKTPFHHIDLSFAGHIDRAIKAGGLIGKFSLSYFSFEDMSPKEDVRSYICNRLRSLEEGINKAPFMSEVELFRFKQRVLETPVRLARKRVWLEKPDITDDSSSAVAKYYPRLASAQHVDLFEKILAVDTHYSKVISQERSRLTPSSYAYLLGEISKVEFLTLEFVRAQRI